jgi:hypothetical protein
MQKFKKLSIGLVLALLTISIAFGAVIIYKTVPMTMRVKMTVALGVFDIDGHTPLTSINLGDFLWGEGFIYPGKLIAGDTPTTFFYVNNTDQTTFHAVQFIVNGLPANSGCSLNIRRMDQPSFTSLRPDTEGQGIFAFDLTSPSLDPTHPLMHAAQFYLTVWTQDNVPFGDFTPTLTINALDSTTG